MLRRWNRYFYETGYGWESMCRYFVVLESSNIYSLISKWYVRRSLRWLRQSVLLFASKSILSESDSFDANTPWKICHSRLVVSQTVWILNEHWQIVFRFTTWDYRPSQWLRINTIIIQTFASVAIRREMCMLHGGSFILLFFLVFFAAMSNGERVQKRQVTHVTLDAN